MQSSFLIYAISVRLQFARRLSSIFLSLFDQCGTNTPVTKLFLLFLMTTSRRSARGFVLASLVFTSYFVLLAIPYAFVITGC